MKIYIVENKTENIYDSSISRPENEADAIMNSKGFKKLKLFLMRDSKLDQ